MGIVLRADALSRDITHVLLIWIRNTRDRHQNLYTYDTVWFFMPCPGFARTSGHDGV